MNDRIAEEKITVSLMIHMYCRHKEGNRELCPDCAGLLAYAVYSGVNVPSVAF